MNATITLGLRKNWKQFSLLVFINGLVGAMVGTERSIFPQFASERFSLDSYTATLAFIVAFGLAKALANYMTGRLADQFGRRRLLWMGWLLALPVPLMLIFAQSWPLVVAANILLGFSQGLCWSSTVVMKIDLVGPRRRGLAMGLNEAAGYLAVGAAAFLTGWMAHRWGVWPYPFYLGLVIASAGFIFSYFFVRDTAPFVRLESEVKQKNLSAPSVALQPEDKNNRRTTFAFAGITQAGFINNLNDGMMWGLFPPLLLQKGFTLDDTALVAGLYPAVWGVGQILTGPWGDRRFFRDLIMFGMVVQGIAIVLMPWTEKYLHFLVLSFGLGLGTALVYPTFLAAIARITEPEERAHKLGVFRFWRDMGYVGGALFSGWVADTLGLPAAILITGILTLISAVATPVLIPSKATLRIF